MANTPSYTLANGQTLRLTVTSSMPCASWSLPAVLSCPAAKASIAQFGEDAICGDCYATKGFYQFASTRDAQWARMRWAIDNLAHDDGNEFVAAMVAMIAADVARRGEPVFRIHDSGDFFSVGYIGAWYRIAEALPDVMFWAPTRSWNVPNLLPALQRLATLPNVTVRPSALQWDTVAPTVDGLAAGTTGVRSLPVLADVGARLCPKTDPRLDQHTCGDCRACWEGSEPVAYFKH